ncbi:MAG TPA: hypothetical protein PLY86_20670, partial [bacterium]|nr:hypothetical protein [bacterium]
MRRTMILTLAGIAGILTLFQGSSLAQSDKAEMSDEFIWNTYVKSSVDTPVEQAYDAILQEVGLNKSDSGPRTISDGAKTQLASLLDAAVAGLPKKFAQRGNCYDEHEGHPFPADHPSMRLAAIVWITRDYGVMELVPTIVKFLDFELNCLTKMREVDIGRGHLDIDLPQVIRQMEIHNQPVLEMLLALGPKSVDPVIEYLESKQQRELGLFGYESFRVMKAIGVLSELDTAGHVSEAQASCIVAAISGLKGDTATASAGQMAWQYRVDLDHISNFYGWYAKDPA